MRNFALTSVLLLGVAACEGEVPPADIANTPEAVEQAAVDSPRVSPLAPIPGELVETRPARRLTRIPNNLPLRNPTGFASTFSPAGYVDLTGPFFQDLGSNGRRCVTCHDPADAWSIAPSSIQQRFARTGGTDAIFRLNDGANSPRADVSTVEARRAAYSMLLTKGLIRVGIPMPANAEFDLVAVDDPYRFASAAELSLFRRPLPSTNLRFLSGVMWDGRETNPDRNIFDNLVEQANSATVGHAEGLAPLSLTVRQQIAQFELGLYTAQIFDSSARWLQGDLAQGGAQTLSTQPFYIGINDLLGDPVTGRPFDSMVFHIYDAWQGPLRGPLASTRAAVARGQALFNSKPIAIRNVRGINDEPVFGTPAVVSGTCTTCHDAPNVGNHSVVAPLDLGLADASRRTPDMPLYTLRNKTTGATLQTMDPGRALISGRWKDIGRFKGPILRGLAARPPYFHDGSAGNLGAVVDFYNTRFAIGLSTAEKADLVAFLRTL